jgi:hypothetical protein
MQPESTDDTKADVALMMSFYLPTVGVQGCLIDGATNDGRSTSL